MRYLDKLLWSIVIVYGLAYIADYACNGCMQEVKPACDEYRGNMYLWWQCSNRAQGK